MSLKNVAKSIRITEEALTAVEQYRGDGFNEKLCNLIHDYIAVGPELAQQISDQRQELEQIRRRVRSTREVDRRLSALVTAVDELIKG